MEKDLDKIQPQDIISGAFTPPRPVPIDEIPEAITPNPFEVINMLPLLLKGKSVAERNDLLRKLSDTVIADYKYDELSRADWKKFTARAIKLFSNFIERKRGSEAEDSNANLPMLAIACLQFHARAIDALLPPKDVVQAVPTGDEDISRAERVKKWMNYELLYKMEDFESEMDKSIFQLPIEGSVFRKTFYDPAKGCNESKYISANDIVIAYKYAGEINNSTRITHVLYLTKDDIRTRVAKGLYVKEAFALGDGSTVSQQVVDNVVKVASDKVQGVNDSNFVSDIPRVVLEQHRLWDFDGDGIGEPYVITVDIESGMVLRITSRSYFNAEGQRDVINYFTHYKFFPNPEGFYGLGFGILLTGINEAANDILNDVVDAGYLANTQGGFISRRSGIKRGSLKFKRGEYKEVDVYAEDLAKSIFNLDFKGPNQTLYAVLGLLYEYSKLVSTVSEIMTGQLPASDSPSNATMALIEEGRKVFSAIHRRIHKSFKQELNKLYRLNGIFLNEDAYRKFLGNNVVAQAMEAGQMPGKNDFAPGYDVIPVSDPNIISRAEKVLKAKQAYELTMSNPLTANNPQAIYISLKSYYEALEISNVNELLQPPPEPPDLAAEDENAQFLMAKPSKVYIQQDHMYHIRVHESLKNGVYKEQIPKEGITILEQHIQEHISMRYMQDVQMEKALQGSEVVRNVNMAGRF